MNWLSQNEERSFELPKIGQHSQQVLKEIGFSNSELDELISENVIDDFKNSAKL
jgi:crotonobetainyl-CoA:carnitine CoA-transferase CaiB-like acyl-CoA transferase